MSSIVLGSGDTKVPNILTYSAVMEHVFMGDKERTIK